MAVLTGRHFLMWHSGNNVNYLKVINYGLIYCTGSLVCLMMSSLNDAGPLVFIHEIIQHFHCGKVSTFVVNNFR